jgi:hypothetical protein
MRKTMLTGLACGVLIGLDFGAINTQAPPRPNLTLVPPKAKSIEPDLPPGIPRGSRRREFKGRSYYIVPLAAVGK